ncbi:Clp protease N-terminal domain-containing protein [Streptomyces silvisoli]|uniref:Clp protease N-terminal domain-containing protein n=1 Tax=Streptomyces silvisoli TaxID=3034235 RepID=A0ABT5ZPE5_9ACTN|nr:Clp protease N-terminal domain-containing protein [Streptomyces silvisoli]MDF3291704.1 Clp protease N-terminal domain-containing protein [Streptomyces silvisoli]
MHSDTRPGEPTSARSGPQLSVELLSVVSSARRRASRDGDRQVDTAHLLHSLLESDPRAREALAAGTADGTARVARVLAYLVQRTIGYGMQWRGTVEDSGALPVLARDIAPGCSPSAVVALDEAGHHATARGAAAADGVDLLAALAADPECRAVEVLRAAGFDPARLAATLPRHGTALEHLGEGPTLAG